MPRVVISYRRKKTAAHAGRLSDRLDRELGRKRVFMDTKSISPGSKFVKTIKQAVDRADALVVVIGKDWEGAKAGRKKRRLDDRKDFVRAEVRRALKRKKRVIPVLVDGASMPEARDLPKDIRKLAKKQAIEVSDARFHADVDPLVDALRGKGGKGDKKGGKGRKKGDKGRKKGKKS